MSPDELTKEWCMNMAKHEAAAGDPECSAGAPARDLVERLRDSSGGHINGLYDREAADEIERLTKLCPMTDHGSLEHFICVLSDAFGSLRAVSRHTGISVGYLSRLASNQNVNPSAATLRKLGIRKLPTLYEPIPKRNP